MRSVGDHMIVGMKDAIKLIGISIITCCAVFVCTLFLNYNMDIVSIKQEITSEQMMMLYDASISMSKVTCCISGGCLLLTSVVMLLFYIKHYIDIHKKELGILKALGYSNKKIAKSFWIFGSSVFSGTTIGFLGAYMIMPLFYRVQNEDQLLPDISVQFHPSLFLYLVVIPTIVFSILAVGYACFKLRMPALALLKEQTITTKKSAHRKERQTKELTFISDLKSTTLKSKKALVFFIVFASFCFSAMTQMSFSMGELASFMMGAMILIIGFILACTTLFLAITAVINGNTKTIAMMRAFGYSQKECCKALLGGYRPLAYIGFALGTLYQYVLLYVMVNMVFQEVGSVPSYQFDVPAMIISLVLFMIIYELIMYVYSEKIKRISIKEIMLE